MNRRFGALAVALAAALIVLLWGTLGGHHHVAPPVAPPVKHGDVDKARDCWARPDKHGRRHCAT